MESGTDNAESGPGTNVGGKVGKETASDPPDPGVSLQIGSTVKPADIKLDGFRVIALGGIGRLR